MWRLQYSKNQPQFIFHEMAISMFKFIYLNALWNFDCLCSISNIMNNLLIYYICYYLSLGKYNILPNG